MSQLKFLYETTVKKQVESKVTTKDPKDPSIEVTKTVKTAKPIKIAILKPRRNLYESAEIFYAKKIADFMREGLLAYSLVQKRYANDGGALSEPEKQLIEDLRDEVTKCKNEYFAFDNADVSEETNTKKNELLVRINDVNSKLSSIENAYADIFDNTAEVKAKNKTIEWWVLHLCYYDLDGKGYQPIFAGDTHDARFKSYDDIEDKDDPFDLEAISLCSYLISFWLTARGSLTKDELEKIEFSTMEKLYLETVSTYEVENDEEPKTTVAVDERSPKEEKNPASTVAKPAPKPAPKVEPKVEPKEEPKVEPQAEIKV